MSLESKLAREGRAIASWAFKSVVAAFFLVSQYDLTKHESAVQTLALSGRTPEFVDNGTTHGQLAPDLRAGGGWLEHASSVRQFERANVPILGKVTRTIKKGWVRIEKKLAEKESGDGWCILTLNLRVWLDGRLFQVLDKVADNFGTETGRVVKKTFIKRDVDWVETAALRSLTKTSIHPLTVVMVPVGGLEPTTKASLTLEIEVSGVSDTALTQTMAETECATVLDHAPGRAGRQASRRRRRGGGRVGSNANSPRGLHERGIWAKADRFERL